MGPLQLALWAVGILLIAVGYLRGRGPYRRYRELKAQDENIARYEAWRGGSRSDDKTGASVAMDILKRQAQVGAALLAVGVVIVFLGFFVS
jgi:hypothetical protein